MRQSKKLYIMGFSIMKQVNVYFNLQIPKGGIFSEKYKTNSKINSKIIL